MTKYDLTLNRLPKHLRQYIVNQNYNKYTAIDHAVWRYIMRLNYDFLKNKAHVSYIEGLKKTGISTERIPELTEMNEILSKIGWGAVCVDGFIPPAAFMEFQAYKVLVIAADMRNIMHIEYTPAPDIVHEAAGHAPIIADPAYAEYLRLFGEIGSKAISSKKDNELYEAIRKLSILKENSNTSQKQMQEAEQQLIEIQNNMGEASEMAKLRNLHWWTVEYGLIGDMEKPQIYGAGLLSSIGESADCLGPAVKKIPYSIAAANYSFDITTKQPQLFVCKDFAHLTEVLNEFADTMALRKGGTYGLSLAKESNALACCQLSSGLQVSGIFDKMLLNSKDEIIYFNTKGPSMLSENDKLLIGHGKDYHKDGFGSPVGKLKGTEKPLEEMKINELQNIGIHIGKKNKLTFESGIVVEGILESIYQNKYGKILIMSFKDCRVQFENGILFHPEWGMYDMAVGTEIVSVFAGAADMENFGSELYKSSTSTSSDNYTDKNYLSIYQQIRDLREKQFHTDSMLSLSKEIEHHYPQDWLAVLELYELAYINKIPENQELKQRLMNKSKTNPELSKLIRDGIQLIEK